MADRVRMDRGDGNLFWVARDEVSKFKAQYGPSAREYEGPDADADDEDDEEEETSDLDSMSKADLEQFASVHGIDLTGAKTNAKRRQAIMDALEDAESEEEFAPSV